MSQRVRFKADSRKAILFAVFVTHGTREAMQNANNLLGSPVTNTTLRSWFNVWRKLPWPNVLARFGKF